MAFLSWLEHSGFSMWVKELESVWGYDLYLTAHGIGMAFIVGLSAAVALRILGAAPGLPLAPMEKFFPFMYAGFWINAISGVVLLVAYPIKAITNPGFYIKMGAMVLAVVCLRRLRRQVFGNLVNLDTRPVPKNDKILAGTLLLLWVVTIAAGKLMEYRGIPGVEWKTSLAVFVAAVAMLLTGYAAARLLGWGKSSPENVQR